MDQRILHLVCELQSDCLHALFCDLLALCLFCPRTLLSFKQTGVEQNTPAILSAPPSLFAPPTSPPARANVSLHILCYQRLPSRNRIHRNLTDSLTSYSFWRGKETKAWRETLAPLKTQDGLVEQTGEWTCMFRFGFVQDKTAHQQLQPHIKVSKGHTTVTGIANIMILNQQRQ